MHRLHLGVVGVVFALAIPGCALPKWGSSLPQPRPLGSEYAMYAPTESDAPAGVSRTARSARTDPTGDLSLREALGLALLRSPELASFAWSVRHAEAEQLQASLLPNPELEAEFENFGGTGDFRGTRGLETTVALSQLVELGGKRAKRMRIAELSSKLAGWDYEAKRLEVLTDVAGKYAALLASQRHVDLARENLKLAKAARSAVEKRISAGKSAPTEGLKADVEMATSGIAARRAERELVVARQQLASTWGAGRAVFDRAVGDLAKIAPLPGIDALTALLAQNPEIAQWEIQGAQRQAELQMARAGSIPDVTVGVGYRHFRETDDNDHAFLVTASIPLPLFDRNQGEISRARFGALKARADRDAAEVRLHAELTEAYQRLALAYDESRSLQDEVLPTAEKAYEAAQRSFREGKSDYLDLLDAQRTWASAQSEHVDALVGYHQARADVEAMVGQSIESVGTEPQSDEDTTNEK
jgi:outer membrane protein, heavy metal efflux system